MTSFNKYNSTIIKCVWRMLAHVWTSNPSMLRITPMLIILSRCFFCSTFIIANFFFSRSNSNGRPCASASASNCANKSWSALSKSTTAASATIAFTISTCRPPILILFSSFVACSAFNIFSFLLSFWIRLSATIPHILIVVFKLFDIIIILNFYSYCRIVK